MIKKNKTDFENQQKISKILEESGLQTDRNQFDPMRQGGLYVNFIRALNKKHNLFIDSLIIPN